MRKRGIRTAALLAGLALAAPAAWAQGTTASQTVDVMNQLWGRHPGFRANHAKGVVTEGVFVASQGAAALSKASIFEGKPVPVTVRFSDSTGLPTLPDGSNDANPHGMAIKFHLADGGEMDVVINSIAFFPVATGEEFRDLLLALAASGPDAPKPTKAEQFIAAHPAVLKALGSVSTPASFATEVYNGVNAFVFVDAAGQRQPFRFKVVPAGGAEHLDAAAAAKLAPDFLVEELPQRLAKGPVVFRVMAQLANPGDQTKDSTQPWPGDRRMAEMGALTITKAAADSLAAQKALRYLPNRVPPGIELSDDPLILARVQAYLVSFGRRAQ